MLTCRRCGAMHVTRERGFIDGCSMCPPRYHLSEQACQELKHQPWYYNGGSDIVADQADSHNAAIDDYEEWERWL